YFARLPRSFREQYQQTALRQKKKLLSHPFARSAPLNGRKISFRDRVIKNLPQMYAILYLGTLGKMEPCPAYRLVPQYKVTLPTSEARHPNSLNSHNYDVSFSPSSDHLLLYGSWLNDARILARDDRGQWSQERLNWSDNNRSRVITGATFSACAGRLLTLSNEGCVNTLVPAHRCWDEVDKVTWSDQFLLFSRSGKYMVTYTTDYPLTIRCMGENNDWLTMPVSGLPESKVRGKAIFSPSEQHLALHGRTEITMLSLNDHGGWSAQKLTLLRRDSIDYANFSQVEDQLLVGFYSHWTSVGRVSIYSPQASGKWQATIIFPNYAQLDLSPAGKYLHTRYTHCYTHDSCMMELWRRPKKLSDWSLNHCYPDLDSRSRAWLESAIELKHKTTIENARFSPSDSHLVVSCKTGTVYIWGKNEADKWSIQTITDQCAPATKPCFSLSGLHVLSYNKTMAGILGRSQQKDWPLKGVIRQDGILKAWFNPLSEHEVVVLSRTENDSITLTVWEINDAGTPD
uniref:WD40 repeat domain-containing protein n=1 Tax=Endozoicomonas sp. ONNA2 TaxID=2828741 RepID=UPI0021490399